jgi:exodeoxyribonuclease V
MMIRAGNSLQEGHYGESAVVCREAVDPARVIGADQILVGRNATRRAYNANGRQARLPAQQPPQGLIQWRPVGGQRSAEEAAANSPHSA